VRAVVRVDRVFFDLFFRCGSNRFEAIDLLRPGTKARNRRGGLIPRADGEGRARLTVVAWLYVHMHAFLCLFFAVYEIARVHWHDTSHGARSRVVSSAIAGGFLPQGTQGSGTPAPAERADENSVVRRCALTRSAGMPVPHDS